MDMEFVIVMERCVFLTGIISRWNVLTVLAVICFPYLASQETGDVVQNSWVKMIETTRNVTHGNMTITSSNQKENTSHVVNIRHFNESLHTAEDNVNKNFDNPGEILSFKTIVAVNKTSLSLKEETSHVTSLNVINSRTYSDGNSRPTTEITVNKTSGGVEKSSRSVTIVSVKNNSRYVKEGNSDMTGVKGNISGINVNEMSGHASELKVTKNKNDSSQWTDLVAKFTNTTSLNPRSRRLTDVPINNSSVSSNLQSRRVTEEAHNALRGGLDKRSRGVTDGAINNSSVSLNLQSRRVTESTMNASRTGPNNGSRNVTSWESEDEGSAFGSLSNILGMSDDEGDDLVNEEDDDGAADFARRADNHEDDGGGGEDEADDAMVPDVNNTTLVTCFRCHGDGINGCDVTTMLDNVVVHSVVCSGKCLNVSSEYPFTTIQCFQLPLSSVMSTQRSEAALVSIACQYDPLAGQYLFLVSQPVEPTSASHQYIQVPSPFVQKYVATSCVGNHSFITIVSVKGSTAVYDCAHDMQTQTDTCLQNDDTEMCFCTGSFCNGPSRPSGFNFSSSLPYPDHLLPPDVDYYDNEINSSEEILKQDDVLIQKSTTNLARNDTNINTSKIWNEINESSVEIGKGRPGFVGRTHTTEKKEGSNSYLQDLFTQNNTQNSKDIWSQFNLNQKNKINYIISENSSDSRNNSITKEPLSPNAIGISDLRVGKLKDSLREEVTKNCQTRVNMFSLILPWVICALISTLNGL